LLFRTQKHVERLNASATRMCMPEVPGELFIEGLKKLVYLDKNWIPPQEGSALYLRPFMVAMDHSIGVRPSSSYKFMILTLPVGPYYPKPVKLKAAEKFVRAVRGGVGEAKTAGNYAASLLPARIAQSEGYDQMMWLDAFEFRQIQEVGTMNIFFVIGDEIITPATDGAILKGITRMSVIDYLRSEGKTVTERAVFIDEIIEAYNNGTLNEVFGTGTAAVISMVCKIKYRDVILDLDVDSYMIAPQAKNFINKLRTREIEDRFGWVEPISSNVLND
jgi:branched-chain amino acid aminotransferase